ncbi:flavodoxin domain-containing protein [Hydrocarboniclastica marina]|uniref:Flavodoxin n=1 Tax=Hydrocarboniclastica marina TaxID=2259620 RepID=A0A4P7XLA4_9ALTE|nr:flavodoxin domain-containing protein [Hydrocarboniclastica marina]MAL97422.1 flavodoxin [Alteromonadaceae bacterium]QCF27314.1 flavodoxin [Hydrocarboniclastica marina]|tara:strand:- start:2931 stop:3383 length:453 start_codon:yes stop_codon:yes gene_type:complete
MTDITIFVGTVFGGARSTADAIADSLAELGLKIRVVDEPSLADLEAESSAILICTSTTGQGELPANILPFYLNIRDTLPLQQGRPFGVIVLGDSMYGDSFCGAGNLIEEAFYELACTKVGDTLRIDASETVEPESLAVPWSRAWARALPA